MISTDSKLLEHERLGKLIKEFSEEVTDKTKFETELFNQIYNIINSLKTPSENIKSDYTIQFKTLQNIALYLDEIKINCHTIKEIKLYVEEVFAIIAPKIKYCNVKKILELMLKISYSIAYRSINVY